MDVFEYIKSLTKKDPTRHMTLVGLPGEEISLQKAKETFSFLSSIKAHENLKFDRHLLELIEMALATGAVKPVDLVIEDSNPTVSLIAQVTGVENSNSIGSAICSIMNKCAENEYGVDGLFIEEVFDPKTPWTLAWMQAHHAHKNLKNKGKLKECLHKVWSLTSDSPNIVATVNTYAIRFFNEGVESEIDIFVEIMEKHRKKGKVAQLNVYLTQYLRDNNGLPFLTYVALHGGENAIKI